MIDKSIFNRHQCHYWYSKNLINFRNIIHVYDKLFISIITYIELPGYNFRSENEYNLIKELVNIIPISFIDIEIADIAVA